MNRQPSSKTCRQCGGTLAGVPGRDYLQCQYCLSLAFLTDDPLTVDRIIPLDSQVASCCPGGHGPLRKGLLDDRPALYCGSCFGVLLPNDAFGTLIGHRRARRGSVEYEDPRPIDPRQYERRLFCPNCSSRMEVHPYYGPGNIVIDSCSRCLLIWLDHGELACVERARGGREPMAVSAPSPTEIATAGDRGTPLRDDHPLELLASLLF